MIEPFDSEAGYRAAIDATLQSACHEIRIFDSNLERLLLDDAGRSALLTAFLSGGQDRRLRLILHEKGPLLTRHPRLLSLIRHRGHQIEIRQTPDHLRHLADCFVLADAAHGVIRFHADHARGKRIGDDSKEIHPYWQRFDDLWLESLICTVPAAGL